MAKSKKRVSIRGEGGAFGSNPAKPSETPAPKVEGKAIRAKLQGDGSPEDLATLDAIATVTRQARGKVIARGLALVLEAMPEMERAKALKLRATLLETRPR